jgi:hypothetical protein
MESRNGGARRRPWVLAAWALATLTFSSSLVPPWL